MWINNFFPPRDTLVELEVEELAIPLLRCLIHEEDSGQKQNLNPPANR